MIGHSDDRRFAFVPNKFGFIFHFQLGLAVLVLSCSIPNPRIDGARIAFFAVLTAILEQHAFASIAMDGPRPVPLLLPPALEPAMQAVPCTVATQLVRSTIEIAKLGVLDAVSGPAYRFAEVGMVDGGVEGGLGKGQHDVVASDLELLDGGAAGKEGEG